MIKKLLYKKSPTNLTIKAIEAKLAEYGFSNGFTQEVGSVLAERKKRIRQRKEIPKMVNAFELSSS